MPFLLGKFNTIEGKKPIPILCTLPVHKFGQMVLYDFQLNRSMEGKLSTEDSKSNDTKPNFDLDDVDSLFDYIQTVKYSQHITFQQIIDNIFHEKHLKKNEFYSKISFCAYPSGRTIGGAMWKIRYGHTDIIYAMDIQLRREMVLDGCGIDLLPTTSPAIMILESGSLSKVAITSRFNKPNGSTISHKKEREDYNKIIESVITTLRNGGNVLIPCETAGRTLEWLQIFSKYWYDNKIGLYHLIYLSHMSNNTLEFARSQLEWMNDNLSENFYNGKLNPFTLLPLKTYTSIYEMENNSIGPKIVFATDASLTCGLSKELLLRWGGDPNNKIIFIDNPLKQSLASEILNQIMNPPIIVSVLRPQRIELIGDELLQYKLNKEKLQRLNEEIRQRKLLENELALVSYLIC